MSWKAPEIKCHVLEIDWYSIPILFLHAIPGMLIYRDMLPPNAVEFNTRLSHLVRHFEIPRILPFDL
jgi:hypothetical protein